MPKLTPTEWLRLLIQIVGLGLVMIAGVWRLSGVLHVQEATLIRIERQTKGQWTAADMKLWTTQLERENVELTVPDPWRVVGHRNGHGR